MSHSRRGRARPEEDRSGERQERKEEGRLLRELTAEEGLHLCELQSFGREHRAILRRGGVAHEAEPAFRIVPVDRRAETRTDREIEIEQERDQRQSERTPESARRERRAAASIAPGQDERHRDRRSEQDHGQMVRESHPEPEPRGVQRRARAWCRDADARREQQRDQEGVERIDLDHHRL